MARSNARPVRPSKGARWPFALVLGLAAACSGDGCTSGCGGITPLPGGYPAEKRIENSAGVRITQSGFDFLEDNIGVLAANLIGEGQSTIEFPIDETSGSIDAGLFDVAYTICPGGPSQSPKKCYVEIDLGNADLSIQPVGPHNIQITGPIPVRIQELGLDTDLGGVDITLTGNGACPGENSTFANIGATIELSIETETNMMYGRYGYSRVRVVQVQLSESDIENSIDFCNGGLLGIILDFAKGFVVGQVADQFLGTIGETIEEQLCQQANPMVTPSCPIGSMDDGSGVCMYADGTCAPIVLGMDGHANLSGLLASLSPGTKGGMDFLLAAGGPSPRPDGSGHTWGDLNPLGGGATLAMFGGVEGSPVSGCVPLSQLPLPTGLLLPDELIDDTLITDWPMGTPGPHVGIGVSESFFNYALNGMYNSGLLCLGLSTETVDLLNSDTLGLLAGSLKDLALQREKAPVAVVLKPRRPPHVTFGNGTNLESDPLILLELPEATFDFYILSHDRFIRFMSAQFDIRAPINLDVTPEGLVPVLDKLAIENGVVQNTELLKEDPAVLAAALQSLLSGQIGALLGEGLPPVDLAGVFDSLGIQLVIPPTVEGQGSPGLRTVTKDGERYLGIFAALEIPMMNLTSLETEATLEEVRVDEAGLRAESINPDNAPVALIEIETRGAEGALVEHQVRVDGGMWRPWTRDRFIHLQDESFRLEGRHLVEVRSRVVGQPSTMDRTPEPLVVVIDTQSPEVKVGAVGAERTAAIDVYDLVSSDAVTLRYRFDDGTFSAWQPALDLRSVAVPDEAEEVEIEAIDEAGNVGTARQAIVRGLPRDAESGCSCSVPAAPSSSGAGWLAALAGAALLALRGGRRAVKRASLARLLSRSGAARAAAGVALVASGGTFAGCSCGEETDPKGRYSCKEPDCVTLQAGLIGSYTSAAVDDKGKLWVAGYLEADWDNAYTWGDLVVGAFDETSGLVAWQIVDGVPADPPVDGKLFNLEGFRGGQTAPGDDVGIWTSLAVDPSGNPAVAYYDRTNKALKLARLSDGEWSVERVDGAAGADVGRYAKLVFDGGAPAIAYLVIEPAASGFITSRLKLATKSGGSWAFEDVVVNAATPCRAAFCQGGTVCVADTGQCTATASGCAAECAAGEECVTVEGSTSCREVLTNKVDAYPLASGLYVSLSPVPGGGLGIAYYDRVAGTVNVAARGGSGWSSLVVDGGPQPDGSISDVGVGASLFIDSGGDWHVSYVDAYNEALKYARVRAGAVQGIEVVDDGLVLGGVQNPDGMHLVGDDSFVRASASGEVRIAYQDATAGKLRFAVGTPGQTGHSWTVRVAETDGFAGFFPNQVEVGGALKIVHFWRKARETTHGDVTVVSPP
jgi:MYXO-CTERM domain-containing protein